MKKYNPEQWNINAFSNSTDDIINRTNNPLERFNRKLKNAFPVPHPSMAAFVNTIKDISVEYVSMLERVKRGTCPRPRHAPLTIHQLPADYLTYVGTKKVANGTLLESTELQKVKWHIGTTHFDPDDGMMFKVTDIWLHKKGKQKCLVGDRIQIPCKTHSLRNGGEPFSDFISIEEILAHTHMTSRCGNSSKKVRFNGSKV